MVGLTCYKPGQRARLFYAVREYTGRKDQPKGFGWRDFRDLIIRARIQLGGPIVLVWDNVRLHLTRPLREFIEANSEWLTVFQLPTYAPDLNPTEGIWSLVKRDIGNLAAANLAEITRAVKRRLKTLQYRPTVVDGCLGATGLSFQDCLAQSAASSCDIAVTRKPCSSTLQMSTTGSGASSSSEKPST
jgi:transposase